MMVVMFIVQATAFTLSSHQFIIVTTFIVQGAYSQDFIFFVTYHWTQKARVLNYTRLERIARGQTL
jgi:hypothetical protein